MYTLDPKNKVWKKYTPKTGDFITLHRGDGTISWHKDNTKLDLDYLRCVWAKGSHDNKLDFQKLRDASKISQNEEKELFMLMAYFLSHGFGFDGITIKENDQLIHAFFEKI